MCAQTKCFVPGGNGSAQLSRVVPTGELPSSLGLWGGDAAGRRHEKAMAGTNRRASYGILFAFAVSGLLLNSSRGFAAGGPCPSAMNYLDPNTNTLVALSSLGVTNCYFISAAGADSNEGTRESAPWLHLPGMPNCTGTCASTKPGAGTGFILRGGDTWHFGNSSASPYTGGMWTWRWNGSSGSPIYIGVDQNWYSGSSWTRPVMNGDNPLSTSAVASCKYQVGALNSFLNASVLSYVTFDNFEFTGKCEGNSAAKFGFDIYVLDQSAKYTNFEHLYFHGWTHIHWKCSRGVGLCYDGYAFLGGEGSGVQTGTSYLYIVVDGADSDPASGGGFYDGMYNVAYSVFKNGSENIGSYDHVFHDNLVMNWVEPGDGYSHGNVYEEVTEPAGTNAIYNNVWYDLYNTGPEGVCFWPVPSVGSSLYVFNNVWYNARCGGNYIDVGENSSDQGAIYFFNNTLENPQNRAILTCASSGYSEPFTAANNHYITDAAPYYPSCRKGAKIAEVPMTHTSAKRQGYAAVGDLRVLTRERIGIDDWYGDK